MLNDIYALSMGGHYESRRDGEIIERGTWSYKGHGNAEITLEASTGPGPAPILYEVRVHSAERQIDEFQCESGPGGDSSSSGAGRQSISAKVTGHLVEMRVNNQDGEPFEGVVSVPPETVYDGPSPVWMIHLMMTAPPPADREVTTPFVRLDPLTGGMTEGFFRVWRSDATVRLLELNIDGEEVEEWELELADDGCPRFIRNSRMEQEVIRVPQVIGL
jgi:hypothetical protein